jgi:hypothetical protein
LKDGGLRPASWWGESFLFLRDLRSDGGGVKLEIVIWDPTQQVESDTSCLHTGITANFPDVTYRRYMGSFKPYVDYYGMVIYEYPHMLFAAME